MNATVSASPTDISTIPRRPADILMNILLITLHAQHSPQAVPLAAANLMAALPFERRSQTRILDLFMDQPPALMLEHINNAKPELVSFSTYLWNRQTVLDLCATLKEQPEPPFILLGGPEASADPDRLLATGTIDALLRGEGEESFPQLVDALYNDRPLKEIPGLCTSSRRDTPAACSCDPEKLRSPWLELKLQSRSRGVLWEVARGCPFHCSFCYDAKGLAGVRPLPEQRLAAELDFFLVNDVDQVWVLDASFNVPAARGKKLLRLLTTKAPQLHYHLEAKAEHIDAETVELLGQLSCSVQLGLQTADDEVLAALNRKIDPRRFWRGVEQVAYSQVTFGLDLIYGLPGDSCEGFVASLDRALSYRPNQVDVFPLAVLPGTELHRRRTDLGLQADELPPYTIRRSREFSEPELERCRRLKLATDIFYNRGRAVGYFLPVCKSFQVKPVDMLERFALWLGEQPEGERFFSETDSLDATEIFKLQQNFFRQQLQAIDRDAWWPLLLDTLKYHYHYAEALVGAEALPNRSAQPKSTRIQRAPGVQLIRFEHEILGTLESEEIDLARWQRRLDQGPSYGLMARRGNQVLVEELTTEFYQLLDRATRITPKTELVAGMPASLARELFDFAWQEGLLVEAT